MFMPLILMQPASVNGYILSNCFTKVDLPDPVFPTIPKVFPCSIFKLMFFKVAPSALGYLKLKFLNSITSNFGTSIALILS